jgi:hypothetical protein
MRGSLLVRNGKGGGRREIGMDAWATLASRPVIAHSERLQFTGEDAPFAWNAAVFT